MRAHARSSGCAPSLACAWSSTSMSPRRMGLRAQACHAASAVQQALSQIKPGGRLAHPIRLYPSLRLTEGDSKSMSLPVPMRKRSSELCSSCAGEAASAQPAAWRPLSARRQRQRRPCPAGQRSAAPFRPCASALAPVGGAAVARAGCSSRGPRFLSRARHGKELLRKLRLARVRGWRDRLSDAARRCGLVIGARLRVVGASARQDSAVTARAVHSLRRPRPRAAHHRNA